jgi:hypothetical protein
MTLLELATFVCTKAGKADGTSYSVCKDFIKNRYKMIWEYYTWNDSKIMVTQSVPASTLDLSINSQIDLVISAAWKGQKLQNLSQETVISYNPDLLDRAGSPVGYINLPKSGGSCVIRFITTPQTTEDIILLGKKVFTQLSGDSDSPLLRGIDNALLAYGEADFLERERQRGAAQLKLQEATAMIQKMVDIESNQQTKVMRVIPTIHDAYYSSCGYNNPWPKNS